MGQGLDDVAAHNAWATAQVLAFCKELDPAVLDATAPGTYGTIIETLRHIIDSEAGYLFRVTGAWPELPWPKGEAVGLDVLSARADQLAPVFARFAEGDIDPDWRGTARGDNGDVFSVPAGVFLTQILHHANEHRAHICTILGALGYEPPPVSSWEYSMATGRSTLMQSLDPAR